MRPMSEDQRQLHRERWSAALAAHNGRLVRDCVFEVDGVRYDLSASDPERFDLIRERGLSVVH